MIVPFGLVKWLPSDNGNEVWTSGMAGFKPSDAYIACTFKIADGRIGTAQKGTKGSSLG